MVVVHIVVHYEYALSSVAATAATELLLLLFDMLLWPLPLLLCSIQTTWKLKLDYFLAIFHKQQLHFIFRLSSSKWTFGYELISRALIVLVVFMRTFYLLFSTNFLFFSFVRSFIRSALGCYLIFLVLFDGENVLTRTLRDNGTMKWRAIQTRNKSA